METALPSSVQSFRAELSFAKAGDVQQEGRRPRGKGAGTRGRGMNLKQRKSNFCSRAGPGTGDPVVRIRTKGVPGRGKGCLPSESRSPTPRKSPSPETRWHARTLARARDARLPGNCSSCPHDPPQPPNSQRKERLRVGGTSVRLRMAEIEDTLINQPG